MTVPTPPVCPCCGKRHETSVPSGRMTPAFVATWPFGPVLGPFELRSDAERALGDAGMAGIGSVMPTHVPQGTRQGRWTR